MKRIVAFAFALTAVITCFASCSRKFECDFCGETKTGKKYEQEYFGEKVTVCKECRDDIMAIWE